MSLGTYRNELKTQLNSPECKRAFEELKQHQLIMEHYPTVESLCELLSPANKNYAHKDEVMVILLTRLSQDKAVYPLINLMFWKMLRSVYYYYRRRQDQLLDPGALYNEIRSSFYEVVITHDLERIPKKIAVNIFLNTKHKVMDWVEKNRRHKQALREYRDSCRQTAYYPAEESFQVEDAQVYLEDMRSQGVITRLQYELILYTQVYKQVSLKAWAKQKGICYNTVKSLRYRANMAIRSFILSNQQR